MERLPYIDEFAAGVDAPPERTWEAVTRVMRGRPLGGGTLARLLGATPAARAGDWRADDPTGATVPGFELAEALRPYRVEFRGRHRFASYALVFQIDEESVRARTYAAFPGVKGRLYRALVIGSHGHELVVRRMLRRIATLAAVPSG